MPGPASASAAASVARWGKSNGLTAGPPARPPGRPGRPGFPAGPTRRSPHRAPRRGSGPAGRAGARPRGRGRRRGRRPASRRPVRATTVVAARRDEQRRRVRHQGDGRRAAEAPAGHRPLAGAEPVAGQRRQEGGVEHAGRRQRRRAADREHQQAHGDLGRGEGPHGGGRGREAQPPDEQGRRYRAPQLEDARRRPGRQRRATPPRRRSARTMRRPSPSRRRSVTDRSHVGLVPSSATVGGREVTLRALGGVRAPGGLPRLQSGWSQRPCDGGFDSRPPPLRASRGPATLTSPCRRVTPLRVELGEQRQRVPPARAEGGADLRDGDAVGMVRQQARHRLARRARSHRRRSARRGARRPIPAGRAGAARPPPPPPVEEARTARRRARRGRGAAPGGAAGPPRARARPRSTVRSSIVARTARCRSSSRAISRPGCPADVTASRIAAAVAASSPAATTQRPTVGGRRSPVVASRSSASTQPRSSIMRSTSPRRPGAGRRQDGGHVEDRSSPDGLPPAVLPQHVPVAGHQRQGHGQPEADVAPLARRQRPGTEQAQADPVLAAAHVGGVGAAPAHLVAQRCEHLERGVDRLRRPPLAPADQGVAPPHVREGRRR